MSDKPLNFTVTYPPDVVMVSRSDEPTSRTDDDLERRVAVLEAIIIAMCSNKPFAISLDENGRPMVMTQIPSSALGERWTDVRVALKTHQQGQE